MRLHELFESHEFRVNSTYAWMSTCQPISFIQRDWLTRSRLMSFCAQNETARMWDPLSGKDIMVFKGHTDQVTDIAFSPDGKYLVTCSWDGTTRLWDVATGAEIRRFTGHTNEVRTADFSSDGRHILIASSDNTARLWFIELDDTIHAVCALLTRDLTPEERAQFGIADPGPTCPTS